MNKSPLSSIKIFSITIATTLAFTYTSYALHKMEGGRDSGGGIDLIDYEQRYAWFPGASKFVRYCILSNEKFFLDHSKLNDQIRISLNDWKTTFSRGDQSKGSMVKDLTTDFHESSCESADLKFYFGLVDEEIAKIKATYDDPTAFAKKTETIKSINWAKGIIWVSDKHFKLSSRKTSREQMLLGLRMILKHELGHVFGFTHISGTIMEEEVFGGFLDANSGYKINPTMEKIERHRVLPLAHTNEFYGTLGLQRPSWGIDFKNGKPEPDPVRIQRQRKEETEAYQLLMGKKLEGTIRASFSFGGQGFSFPTLRITQSHGDKDSAIDFEVKGESPQGWFDIFSRCSENGAYVWRVRSTASDASSIEDFSCTLYGAIKTQNGKTLNTIIEYNIDNDYFPGTGPFVIKTISKGKVKVLFQSFFIGDQKAVPSEGLLKK